ncbi:kinase-like domain-containing protein [Leptodontidium sp. 2 PMI_412]|nr:kinase-like domain-containing protein [Leptodontidium sp. 2 PMI_412]
MSLLEEPSDLIAHFKLEACSFPTHTTQVCYTSTPGQGAREVRVEKHWRKAKIVGEGGFGAVWLEERLENNVVKEQRALKEVSKARMKTAGIDVGREVLALARLSKHSPEFVKFYGWFEDERSIFLTMEYLPYGDLSQYIAADGIPEAESGLIASQILDGLIILHKYSFTHRDIKPSNIFVASPSPNWWVKIGDFGITKRVDNDRTAWRTEIGTRGFQAPEISGINGNMVGYTNLVDIWSLGCVLYNILAQELPFHRLADVENYCSGRSPFPKEALQGHNVSQCGISFLEKLLDPLPSERPTAEMARNASWFGEGPPALLVQGLSTDH